MKFHLAISPEPLPRGDRMALCGEMVRNAEFVPLSEDEQDPNSLSRICPKCRQVKDVLRRKYSYALVGGEALKQEER